MSSQHRHTKSYYGRSIKAENWHRTRKNFKQSLHGAACMLLCAIGLYSLALSLFVGVSGLVLR